MRTALVSASFIAIVAACATTALARPTPHPPPVHAGPQHPAYPHALSDLRAARAHLEKPADVNLERRHGDEGVRWDEHEAVGEIDAAIKAIKNAAIDDGKDLGDHPAVDASLAWGGRLGHALELLDRSAKDIEQREDDGFARGLRRRAIQHIETAERFTREGIERTR